MDLARSPVGERAFFILISAAVFYLDGGCKSIISKLPAEGDAPDSGLRLFSRLSIRRLFWRFTLTTSKQCLHRFAHAAKIIGYFDRTGRNNFSDLFVET